MDISRATDLWLGELARQSRSESTVNGYRRLLDKLADTHPFADVADLSASDVRRFLDSQARRRDGKRKSASSIGGNVSTINGFFDWLTKEGIVDRNPTRRNGDRIIDRPPQLAAEDNDNIVSVTFADVQRLLRESRRLGKWEETLAIHCLVYLGPRRKALSLVRLGDYDRLERTLMFREKGGKTIRKPVPDELATVIESAIFAGAYTNPSDYLIPSKAQQRRPGDRDDRVIWRIVKEVAERANVTTHVHALRAAFAVHYLQSKPGEIVGLQKLMGHRRIETTMVYLRRLDRHEAMESVRDRSWNPANSGESLRSLDVTEKEGFEPSILDDLAPKRVGRQHEGSVPRKRPG
jgi:site-specific recombinase XerD